MPARRRRPAQNRSRRARRGGLGLRALAAALVLAGPVAFLVERVRRRRAGTAPAEGSPPRADWSCACGQDYVVSGTDRHRIYWVTGAATGDPVLGQECVRCGARLPADRTADAA